MSNNNSTIKLGDKVKCRITGFTGVAIYRVEYINGCVKYGVTPCELDKDGKVRDDACFDWKQLEIVTRQAVDMASENTGGPASSTPPAM